MRFRRSRTDLDGVAGLRQEAFYHNASRFTQMEPYGFPSGKCYNLKRRPEIAINKFPPALTAGDFAS